jgi:FtsZ-interacting cell division protein ZipA
MVLAMNIVLMVAVVVAIVAFLLHGIRSDRRHRQQQAMASRRRGAAARYADRRPARSRRRDGEFSARFG